MIIWTTKPINNLSKQQSFLSNAPKLSSQRPKLEIKSLTAAAIAASKIPAPKTKLPVEIKQAAALSRKREEEAKRLEAIKRKEEEKERKAAALLENRKAQVELEKKKHAEKVARQQEKLRELEDEKERKVRGLEEKMGLVWKPNNNSNNNNNNNNNNNTKNRGDSEKNATTNGGNALSLTCQPHRQELQSHNFQKEKMQKESEKSEPNDDRLKKEKVSPSISAPIQSIAKAHVENSAASHDQIQNSILPEYLTTSNQVEFESSLKHLNHEINPSTSTSKTRIPISNVNIDQPTLILATPPGPKTIVGPDGEIPEVDSEYASYYIYSFLFYLCHFFFVNIDYLYYVQHVYKFYSFRFIMYLNFILFFFFNTALMEMTLNLQTLPRKKLWPLYGRNLLIYREGYWLNLNEIRMKFLEHLKQPHQILTVSTTTFFFFI